MNLLKKLSVCGAALVVAGVATPVQAAPPFNVLKFDINSIKATLTLGGLASDGSSASSYSGTISFFTATGTTTFFAAVQGNNTGSASSSNTFFAAGSPGTLGSFGGSLSFASGVLTGVSLSFSNTVATGSDSYATSVVSGSGALVWTGTEYIVSGNTIGGLFTDGGTAGLFGLGVGAVDISLFMANQGGGGSAFGNFFKFRIPHSVTTTEAVDSEIIIAIPLPQSVAMASVGLFGLGIRRRRL